MINTMPIEICNYTTMSMPSLTTETIVVEKFDDKGRLIERTTTTKSIPINIQPTPWWEQPFNYPKEPTYGPITITCDPLHNKGITVRLEG